MRLFRQKKPSEERKLPHTRSGRSNEQSPATRLMSQLIEGEGYQFGDPWKLSAESLSAVVPILRNVTCARKCLVIQEVPEGRIGISDSGRINKLNVELKSVQKPVFVRAGTIFKGKSTQSRTSGLGIILSPGKSRAVDVFCVHASHRISRSREFSTIRDVVPRKVEDALTSTSKNQGSVWRAAAVRRLRSNATSCVSCGSSRLLQNYEAELVCLECGQTIDPRPRTSAPRDNVRQHPMGRDGAFANSFASMACSSATMSFRDDLIANLDEMTRFNREVEKTLSKVPADLERQVGVVIIDSKGVLGLEMFDHPDSWRAFSRSIVRNYADVLAKERAGGGLFVLKTERIPGAIIKFLEKAQGLSETLIFRNQLGETRMFTGGLTGEYTTLEDDVIHLLLKRKAAR